MIIECLMFLCVSRMTELFVVHYANIVKLKLNDKRPRRDTHYTRAVMPSEDLLETRLTAPLNLFFIVAVWRLYSDVRML